MSVSKGHIIVVEAYQGYLEYLSDELEERRYALGLGLPLDQIADDLGCRITILCWDEWLRWECQFGSPFTWVRAPATRPLWQPELPDLSYPIESANVSRVPIPLRNPEHWLLFDEQGLNPRSVGFSENDDISFLMSYCLKSELQILHKEDPYQAVLFPLWGGLGYVSQMARATGTSNGGNVPCAVVAADLSKNRIQSNQEGYWTRQAVVRRQMEDVSLALADLVIVFGPRGRELTLDGRLPQSDPPVCAPRFVESSVLERITAASTYTYDNRKSIQFFMYEPQQASSGILSALDAVTLLWNKAVRLERPLICAGRPMVFAPMKPRFFEDYWSTRGSVRDLIREGQWKWERNYPDLQNVFPVRLYPSFFDHLPSVWTELARGSLVVLSGAAADGLAPDETLPDEVLIKGEPTPENIMNSIQRLLAAGVEHLDQVRRELCLRVLAAHKEERRTSRMRNVANALQGLLRSPIKQQDLSRVSQIFLDRHLSLRTIAQNKTFPDFPPLQQLEPRNPSLTVVITCHEIRSMIVEAVRSVWASERLPDEVLLVDDGSYGYETLTGINQLEDEAAQRSLSLKVIRQRNKGLPAARNAGLGLATGDCISFLDGDDLIDPAYYRIALEILRKYPRLGGVAAWSFIFGKEVRDCFWNAPQAELPFLYVENTIFVPFVIRTQLLRQLGGYDTGQRFNYEDWELSIRILESGWPIVTIPAYLAKYRVRKDSLLRTASSVQNQVMREYMFAKHSEGVSKFATEIAMLIEDQLRVDWAAKL